MIPENNYYIFEFEENGRKEEILFDSKKYFYIENDVDLDKIQLLHIHLDDLDYYLLLWYGNSNSSHYFQFNKGEEFSEFLKNHGVSYQRFDVLSIEASYGPVFRLKSDQIIEFQTYANGSWEGMEIYDISDKSKKQQLFNGPKGKLKLDKVDRDVELKWKGKSENNELPKSFRDFRAKQAKVKKYAPLYMFLFIVMFVVLFYLAGEVLTWLFPSLGED